MSAEQPKPFDQRNFWALVVQRAYTLARVRRIPDTYVRGNRRLFEEAALQIRQESNTRTNPDIIKK